MECPICHMQYNEHQARLYEAHLIAHKVIARADKDRKRLEQAEAALAALRAEEER